jgi:hypothetical protein
LNSLLEQTQEVEGRGKDSKTILRTKADFTAFRNLDIKMAKAIVRKMTNFAMETENVSYPMYEKGKDGKEDKTKITEQWCTDARLIEKMIEVMPEEWLSELINSARELSELKPFEKKS